MIISELVLNPDEIKNIDPCYLPITCFTFGAIKIMLSVVLCPCSAIKWNFTKFIIDKKGQPVKRYATTTNPLVS